MNRPMNSTPHATPSFQWVFQNPLRILAFGFGSGLSPIAPGTIGTLWAWAAFLISAPFLDRAQTWWVIGLGIALGCWICGRTSEELGKADFGGIVWDEIVAFWLILILIMPSSFYLQLLAFTLFRFFDAVKPGPIGLIDRHFKTQEAMNTNSKSSAREMGWRGFGIIADDLAAALFTLLALALIQLALKAIF